MSTDAERALSTARKRRGVAKASITRLETRVADLERKEVLSPEDRLSTQHLTQRLDSLDADFRTHHFAVVDLLNEEDTSAFDTQQAILDENDERVASLTVRIQRLAASSPSSSTRTAESDPVQRLNRQLRHLNKETQVVKNALKDESGLDSCLLQQYEEVLSGLKTEITRVSHEILALGAEEGDLSGERDSLSQTLFDLSLEIRRLIQRKTSGATATSSTPPEKSGVKLPKLTVPTFDGNILNWRSFWEQYSVSVHDRTDLSSSEKLTYLKQSLQVGSARHVVEGLSGSGDQYVEAVDCLRKRFDKPRLLHQAHVRAVVDAASVKTGSGKELRRLHDTINQHLRALKSMEYEPSGHFITSLIEMKLDPDTMFEWQKHSQGSSTVPHCSVLLDFIDLRAQAAESAVPDVIKKRPQEGSPLKGNFIPRRLPSLHATENEQCMVCKNGKHPLYSCQKFRSLPREQMMSIVKSNELCFNCLKPGHFLRDCKSVQRCKKCQKRHHTYLHLEDAPPPPMENPTPEHSHVASAASKSRKFLLMTCRVLATSPNGVTTQARALLDSASSTSFISERLVQRLHLPRRRQQAQITGIGGLAHQSLGQSVVHFGVSPLSSMDKKFEVEAIVLPKVTSDIPVCSIPFNQNWRHLSGIHLADPDFGVPSKIDILLGVDIFSDALLQGRRSGPSGSPTAFETCFGWILVGVVDGNSIPTNVVSNHAAVLSTDDLLQRFWESEEHDVRSPSSLVGCTLSADEQSVMTHFQSKHRRDECGRFIVPLPRRSDTKPLGESRSLAVRRFLSLERSLRLKGHFQELSAVVEEYFEMEHAEPVPVADLDKPCKDVFYLPMHAVFKESSTTTKVRAVFDASAKSSTGVSLNDQLLVGPTVHSSLIDVLLRFRLHRIALSADVSRMYRAIILPTDERDLHRFVWRQHPDEDLKDFRMTRVTFGVASSSFAANMSIRQNAVDHVGEFPMASAAVLSSFYVDDGLVGADTLDEAIQLQRELQSLFERGGFLLRKWKSNTPAAVQHLPPDLLDPQSSQAIQDPDGFAKALGVEWSTNLDSFRLTVSQFPKLEAVTKRALVSDVAKTFDVLGWFAPAIVKIKILLQRLWEAGVDWDDQVPIAIQENWEKWRRELPVLTKKLIPRCYFAKEVRPESMQLHGFSDASEAAYAGVVYLRTVDSTAKAHVSLVIAKTRVAPLKRLTIPRLELCGANLLANLLHHVKKIFDLPYESVFAWTDSTVVLSWLSGNPRRFKVYVGNRVSNILSQVPFDCWHHVAGKENPADAASRGQLPSELLGNELWWRAPDWLWQPESQWPRTPVLEKTPVPVEEREISLVSHVAPRNAPFWERFSSFTRLCRVTAWMFRFINVCKKIPVHKMDHLTVDEIRHTERHWISVSQASAFPEEVLCLKKGHPLPSRSSLLSLHPVVDVYGLLRVGGRNEYSGLPYVRRHPLILSGRHGVTKLIIGAEHLRLLHGGPTLVAAMLSRRFHIVGARKAIRSITRACVVCRRISARPKPQMLGQLPSDRLRPGPVFERTGVDYAGPVTVKSGSVRKPMLLKAYICVFVCLSVKAVHLELVTDLTSEAFLAAFRRFISRRGKPSIMWSDNGTNFVGAANHLKELHGFLQQMVTQQKISEFFCSQGIIWKFIPERAPHFGGLWEAAVKSLKQHLRKVVMEAKLTFEEYYTVLTQVEACLNSRPLCALPDSDEGVEVLTPGHFLVSRPIEALPESSLAYQPHSVLRRWQLCQMIVRQFWRRWSDDYLSTLAKYVKWNYPHRNFQVGDLVCLREEEAFPSKWPMARVAAVHPGEDGLVRVATVKTSRGSYKRPVTKLVLLLPNDKHC